MGKINRAVIYLSLFLTTISGAMSQSADTTNYGVLKLRNEPKFYDVALDSMTNSTANEIYENFVTEFVHIPLDGVSTEPSSNSTCEARLKMLATEIQLPYNDVVGKFIDRYTRSETMANIMGRGKYYFPMIEECLYKYNLPMELKMLPVIESAMIPTARSRASAVGLWQFMLSTAKSYGLEVNSFVDERQDPVKATDAACRYLSDMYKIYGDWSVVIASYNCGSGNINKAIKRAGTAHSYWDLWNYLPRETRNYVPIFIAATYAYTFYKYYNINPIPAPHPLAVDTVMVDRMMHLEQVSSTLDVSLDVLRALNPQYIRDVIPAASRQYKLTLPQKCIGDYIDNLPTIYAKDTIYLTKYLANNNLTKENVAHPSSISPRKIYKVKSGDTLSRIASKHHVTVKQIQKWNKMKSTKLSIGQKLIIY